MEEEKRRRRRRQRPWEDLPPLALVKVFRRTDMKDRIWRIPFVCKSWNEAAHDPRVWSSIITDSISPEDVFVKGFCPYLDEFYIYPFKGEHNLNIFLGVSRLRTLIHRSRGGRTEATSSITSLCLFPFVPPNSHFFTDFPDDHLLQTIGNSCPNLKHFSFHGSHNASEGTIIEFISKCNKLELIDFSHSPYFSIPVIEQLGRSCPNLRGIRIAGRRYFPEPFTTCSKDYIPEPFAIRSNIPQLKILNLGRTSLKKEEILAIQFGSLQILYLDDPKGPQLTYERCNYCKLIYRIRLRSWGKNHPKLEEALLDCIFR